MDILGWTLSVAPLVDDDVAMKDTASEHSPPIKYFTIKNYLHHADNRWNVNSSIADGIVVHLIICHVVLFLNFN